MNYLLKNNRRRPEFYRPFIILAVIVGLAGAFYLLAPRATNQGVFILARPIWSIGDYFSEKFNKTFPIFKEKLVLYEENVSLKKELDDARVALISLDNYKTENASLKKDLGREVSGQRILAVVLKKPGSTSYDSLIIDVGQNKSVKIGDLVMFEDFVIGEIKEVYSDYSKVELSSSPNKSYNVRVGSTGVDVTAVGRGGGNFLIKLPKEVDVKKGDVIKMIDLKSRFFGTVDDIEKTESSSFQFILFRLPVNLNTLEWVEVVKS